MPFHHFGGKVTKDLRQQYQNSPNWKDGKFQNLQPTGMDLDLKDFPKLIYQQFSERSKKQPSRPIPIHSFPKDQLLTTEEAMKFAWYGHSAVFMRMNGKNIFIDPMLGPDASPIAPFKTSRFSKDTLDIIDDLPTLDLVLFTHDHYDHLDYESIKRIKTKTKKYFVALGGKRHLVYWGVDADLVEEFDWWETKEFEGIQITFTPTRHFSGRGLTDRAKSLWGGWAFQSSKESIWFSGDGGFGSHFEEVGKRLGAFDFAFMECGQYNEHWRQLHLFPEESVLAAQHALVKKIMPVHWAGFKLAPHSWKEPVEGFIKKAEELNMDFVIPQLGEVRSWKNSGWTDWWREY